MMITAGLAAPPPRPPFSRLIAPPMRPRPFKVGQVIEQVDARCPHALKSPLEDEVRAVTEGRVWVVILGLQILRSGSSISHIRATYT